MLYVTKQRLITYPRKIHTFLTATEKNSAIKEGEEMSLKGKGTTAVVKCIEKFIKQNVCIFKQRIN